MIADGGHVKRYSGTCRCWGNISITTSSSGSDGSRIVWSDVVFIADGTIFMTLSSDTVTTDTKHLA